MTWISKETWTPEEVNGVLGQEVIRRDGSVVVPEAIQLTHTHFTRCRCRGEGTVFFNTKLSHTTDQWDAVSYFSDLSEFPDGAVVSLRDKPAFKSDGGSSDYYKFSIPKNRVAEDDTHFHLSISEVIKYALNNDFDKGNIFKALVRLGRKEGTSIEYDINKCHWFLDEILAAHKGEQHDVGKGE